MMHTLTHHCTALFPGNKKNKIISAIKTPMLSSGCLVQCMIYLKDRLYYEPLIHRNNSLQKPIFHKTHTEVLQQRSASISLYSYF